MRSGVICVLLVLLIRREGSEAADEDFRPTLIPLNEWHEVRGWRGARAGTLHEVLHAVPAPARYWEDALRHSVYLALVRDKIDQLIAKGDYVDHPADDLDDRDLWDKIKLAPFHRLNDEEPTPVGDVVIVAKGRLTEESGGFRFKEDDKFKDKCATDKCMDGVKALWSVKRVRQRDLDASGRYHYEVTFSVITQKKHRKPFEKPARTFTVRETTPERIVDAPQEHKYYEPVPVPAPVPVQASRGEKALWFHKNIAPTARNQGRQHHNGLDRLFSSLFSDDDDDDIPPPRYKPKQYYPPPPVYQQYSKAGYVGSPSEQQQKKLVPYSHKPHHYKYNQYGRPIPPPPPQPIRHHYLDIEQIGVVSNPYQDHRYGPPIKPGKTPRPAVLPTPPNPVLVTKNYTIETTTQLNTNQSDETTPKPDIVHPPKTYNKQKPTTVKISYATDHVRPPVYNAPPGVFVTMDKKPFKPMPPLRLVHSSKLHKQPRPTDFRPSPQVLDIQFSEPDPLFDTAFRPITVKYENTNTTDKAVTASSDNHLRKSNITIAKKPPKKNEIVKAQRVTTIAPEIITAHSVEEDSDAEWTNVLGAFAKTTPMAAEKDKPKTTETTTPIQDTTTTSTTTTTTSTTTTTLPPPTSNLRKRTTTTTTTEAPTTTIKPKKRTRPPPKFTKPEKVKKHKRVTITTTTTDAPHKRKVLQDLTPQASSASVTASSTSPTTSTSTTTTTSTTPPPTTTTTVKTTTTTTEPTTTTTEPSTTPSTEPPKRKNRYRQSTLKYRSRTLDKTEEKVRTIIPPTGKFPARRKGAKHQDHITSTPKFSDMQFDDEGREDHVVSPYKSKSISTTETVLSTTLRVSTSSTTPAYEEVADHVYITSESPDYSMSHEDFDDDLDEGEDEPELRDSSEHQRADIEALEVTPSDTTNEIVEIEEEPLEIAAEIITTTVSAPKNKTKCKKKKTQNPTEEMKPEESKLEETKIEMKLEETKPEEINPEQTESEVIPLETSSTSTTSTTIETTSTPDIFQEIFGGFTFDDSIAESTNNESTSYPELEEQAASNQEKYIKSEDDFEDFFEAFSGDKHREEHRDGRFDDQYEYDDKDSLDDDDSPFRSEEDRRSRDTQEDEENYDDYPERPYSLLELMAME